MRLLITTEHRFARTSDGTVFSTTGGREYHFWKRYLEIYDEILVFARVQAVTQFERNATRASGPAVKFVDVPNYQGPYEYMRQFFSLRRVAQEYYSSRQAVILRVPGALGGLVGRTLTATDHPYGVEVVGDPAEVFSPGAVVHPLRTLLRPFYVQKLKKQCRRASAVAYVTKHTLQKRYPAHPKAFVTHYSSVDLPNEAFVDEPAPRVMSQGAIRLVFVGTMSQMYKGVDVLLEAVRLLLRKGVQVRLVLLGDGKHRRKLEFQAAELGLEDNVSFVGQVPSGAAVRRHLDQSDIFVLPSRTEGLPRAMLEAMARGLPCIGTNVGGIPELLPPQDRVPPDDPKALARKIANVSRNGDRLAHMRARNLAAARNYHHDILAGRRNRFYVHLREITEEWLSEWNK